VMGYKPNLKNPQTYNEKLQWLKLNDHNPLYTQLVDKYKVRDYIANEIGREHLVPLYGVWDTAEEIDFDTLQNEFVLKANHTSGDVFICKDKEKTDLNLLKKQISKWIKRNYYWKSREWPYKDVRPKIIAEKYLKEFEHGLIDYKIMCFNGKALCTFVCTKRNTEEGLHITIVDRDWNILLVCRKNTPRENFVEKPTTYNSMLSYAEKLSKDMPFVRVDLYEMKEKIMFGELTFYPASGFEGFSPSEWDKKFGDWLKL